MVSIPFKEKDVCVMVISGVMLSSLSSSHAVNAAKIISNRLKFNDFDFMVELVSDK